MIVRLFTAALFGIDAYSVELEVDLTRSGMPAFALVGLAEGAVRESKERVMTGLKNSGFRLPPSRITVNLAPADKRKAGSGFDLPLALGLLAAEGTLSAQQLTGYYFAGELSLTGAVKPVPGVLPVALEARKAGAKGLLVARSCAAEAAVVEGLCVYGVSDLAEAVQFLCGEKDVLATKSNRESLWNTRSEFPVDFAEVKGQEHAKRAIEIAAAGAHNLLFIGPPGSGKTMLASRIPTVLPELSFEEALEVTRIYSVADRLAGQPLLVSRPFRRPHHTISDAGLIGGGAYPRPGEISLAHRGVLFLDELPEFKKHVLEVMRQPLEQGSVTISRAAMSLEFPADVMLVAAMNPCPCGYHGDGFHPCICSSRQVADYRSRVSGPMLDRIDMHIEVPAVPYKDLRALGPKRAGMDSAGIRAKVQKARAIQKKRYKETPVLTNAELSGSLLEQHGALDEQGHAFLEKAVNTLGLSARAYTRILRIARTVADLEGASAISPQHLAEALNCRALDRKRPAI